MDNCYRLFLVKHPIGEFIGVAKGYATAREHWGTKTVITEMTEKDVIDFRASGKPDHVFLAI